MNGFYQSYGKTLLADQYFKGKPSIIDDLLEAMENKKIKGAGLDVLPFEKSSFEQIDHNPQLQQLIKNPHILLSPPLLDGRIKVKNDLRKLLSIR